MNTQHTPAPWTQGLKGKFERYNANNIYDVNGNCVASIPGIPLYCSVETLERSRNTSDANGMANARLIAAAPELLEACQVAFNWNVANDGTERAWTAERLAAFETVKRAITKATKQD